MGIKMSKPTKDDIMALAIEIFGSEILAKDWLSTPIHVLNNQPPNTKLRDKNGLREVEIILNKIKYGEFI